MKRSGLSIILGLLLLVSGIGYLGNAFDLWNFTVFFDGWWTLFLIIPALYSMIKSGIKVVNTLVLVGGLYYLLLNQGIITFEITIPMLVACILILIGINLLFPRKKQIRFDETTYVHQEYQTNHEEPNSMKGLQLTIESVFSSKKCKVVEPFTTAKIEAVFGNVEVDFSALNLSQVQSISIDTVFGQVVMIVNEDVYCQLKEDHVFGKVYYNVNPNFTYKVNVKTGAVFGDIRILTKLGTRSEAFQDDLEEEVITVNVEI